MSMNDDRRIGRSIDHLAGQPAEDEYPLGIPQRVQKEREAMIDALLRPHRQARKFEASSDSRKTVADCDAKGNKLAELMLCGSVRMLADGEDVEDEDGAVRLAVTVTVTLEGQANDVVLADVLARPGVIEYMVAQVRNELLDELNEVEDEDAWTPANPSAYEHERALWLASAPREELEALDERLRAFVAGLGPRANGAP